MRVALKTLVDRSVKNMGTGIHPVVKESAIEMITRAYNEGINVQISSGFRSYAEQNQLYAKGRTALGSIVTNARGGYSNHNFGLAIDYFLVSEDGSSAIWSVNTKWKRVAAIGKSLGFSWGGDWTSFKDYPHLEMTGGLTTSQLRAGRKPTLVSKVPKKDVTVVEKKPVESKDEGELTVKQVEVLQKQIDELKKSLDSKMDTPAKVDDVAKWAEKDWDRVKANGYFDGSRPGGYISRQEAALVTNRIIDNVRKHIEEPLGKRIIELEEEVAKLKGE